ncbi:uncharacterized protein LOC142175979 [Nicotiana tabacum]|uniref:Uncharacterized protein LOC142175979 n=1 Tax=Nicotiana tabacum TaxID=4097 RepID=A0AC58TPE7_TOBAC
MESQNEENPVGSSSSTFPIESESQLPMQVDEVVDETGKRKLISDAWNHFTPVMINRVRFGVYYICNRCRKKPSNLDNEGNSGGDGSQQHYFDQDVSRRELAHAIILHEYPLSIVDHVGFRKFVASL